jgi:hypothetical protein
MYRCELFQTAFDREDDPSWHVQASSERYEISSRNCKEGINLQIL